MTIKTWFGIFEPGKDDSDITLLEIYPADAGVIVEKLAQDSRSLWSGEPRGLDLHDIAIRHGFVDSHEEYDRLLHRVSIELAKKQVRAAIGRDILMAQAVEALDDIDRASNEMLERLHEWHAMFTAGAFDDADNADLVRLFSGIDPKNPEEKLMQTLASNITGLRKTRKDIEEHIKKEMAELAPNLSRISGPLLGARLVSLAGSLSRLASMPSSTVQVLGAGNALFRHLRGKSPPPKHGIIYMHPSISTAPKKLRGRISRALASKIAQAARVDFYSGEIREELDTALEKRLREIRRGK